MARSKSYLVRITVAGARAVATASTDSVGRGPRRNQRPSDRLTVFTKPKVTKSSFIRELREQISPSHSLSEEPAVVILASPRHASWLNNRDFMADLVSVLRLSTAAGQNLHVLAAAVDGLSPEAPNRELQEGFSIQFGDRNSLLPDLWVKTSPEGQERPLRETSSSLSIMMPRKMTSGEAKVTLTLPLANTLFQNGTRSTLLVSEWGQAEGTRGEELKLLRIAEKRSQLINLPSAVLAVELNVRAPLVPITQPRKVLETLGNILAKVEINGESSPASKELQANIPRFVEARRTLAHTNAFTGRVGVWAIVYPKHMFQYGNDLVKFWIVLGARFLGTALGKLAFDMSTDPERVAWETEPVIRKALFGGAHMHRILSGGGEWGAKASLLSLDPQTRHGRDSEEDELDRFIKSFHGEDDAKELNAKPGDYVQFFVERDPVQLTSEKARSLTLRPADYPPVLFGVGDMDMKDIDPRVVRRRRDHQSTISVIFDHFGGYSAEGIYLSSTKVGPHTKIDVPGAFVSMAAGKGSNTTPYSEIVRLKLHKK